MGDNLKKAWPEVEFEFGGNSYKFKPNMRWLRDIQLATGANPSQMDWDAVSPVTEVAAIWSAIKATDKKVSLDWVSETYSPDDHGLALSFIVAYVNCSLAAVRGKNGQAPTTTTEAES